MFFLYCFLKNSALKQNHKTIETVPFGLTNKDSTIYILNKLSDSGVENEFLRGTILTCLSGAQMELKNAKKSCDTAPFMQKR